MRKVVIMAGLYCIAASLISCGNKQQSQNQANATPAKDTSKQALTEAIKAVQAKLNASQSLDPTMANLAINAFLNYAKYYPDDTLSVVYLFKAGEYASSIGQFQRAISMYDNILTKYPQNRLIPECLFIEGFVYDNNLNDTAKARARYMQVIEKYPNDNLASQAKQAIHLLGKTPDEIGKEFEKRNKEKAKANKKA